MSESTAAPLVPTTSIPTPQTRDGNASLRVARGLREAIVAGEYPPGSRLRQEEIAERFGASRVPVREALKVLEADGLIPLLLRLAAGSITDETLDELDSLAEAMVAADDVEEFLRLDRAFHLAMYAGARTLVLSDLVERLWNSTQPYRRAYTLMIDAHSQRIVHDEHHMLVTALREADVDSAERILEGHIRRTRRRLAAHPQLFADTTTDRPTTPRQTTPRQKGPSWPSQ